MTTLVIVAPTIVAPCVASEKAAPVARCRRSGLSDDNDLVGSEPRQACEQSRGEVRAAGDRGKLEVERDDARTRDRPAEERRDLLAGYGDGGRGRIARAAAQKPVNAA